MVAPCWWEAIISNQLRRLRRCQAATLSRGWQALVGGGPVVGMGVVLWGGGAGFLFFFFFLMHWHSSRQPGAKTLSSGIR